MEPQYGKVKSIREKINFIDKKRQNLKLFNELEGDYGHYGFGGPKFTRNRFHEWWYNIPGVHYLNYYKEFNKKGKPIYEIWFYKNGDTLAYFNYKYDEKDNLIQEIEHESENSYSVKNYYYNKKNKLKSRIYYNSDDPTIFSYSEYIYDKQQNIIKIKNFNQRGETYGSKFIYYQKGKVKKAFSYSPSKNRIKPISSDTVNGYLLSRKFIYNENGDCVEQYDYNDDFYSYTRPKLRRKILKKYENGLLIEKTIMLANNTIQRYHLFTHNRQGLKIKEEVILPSFPKNNITYEYFYNTNGNQTGLIYTKDNNSVTVDYKYKFDEKQNWIKQTKVVNGKELYIWIRKIKYYK